MDEDEFMDCIEPVVGIPEGIMLKGRDISAPISNERNSLQFSARISRAEMTMKKEGDTKDDTARLLALRGSFSST